MVCKFQTDIFAIPKNINIQSAHHYQLDDPTDNNILSAFFNDVIARK
jgi:hypothetical protein